MKHFKVSPNKKRIIAFVGTCLAIPAVGITIAYSYDRAVLDNRFNLSEYKTVFEETFSAPTNWLTCETVDKEFFVRNESDKPVSVRFKISESWKNSLDEPLPLVSTASGLMMAQINEVQNSGWTRHGSYYYYDNNLAAGETTTTPISGVTLNCDANLGEGGDDAYSNAQYTLKITAQTIQADAKDLVWDTLYEAVADQVNDLGGYQVNFTRKAIRSNNTSIANGFGVDKYTENGKDVYYFRGPVENNHVIWANFCWLIVRTTDTGGVKMIYNGVPESGQCKTDYDTSTIGLSNFNDSYNGQNRQSPADVGYKYGDRIQPPSSLGTSSYIGGDWVYTVFTFSNDVTRDGDTYTLDTSPGQYVTGTWPDMREMAATRYHYVCADGAASCDSTKIVYIHEAFDDTSSIYHLPVGGYDDIEDMKAAMNANVNDSAIKKKIEDWFEENNLDGHLADTRNYEDDLEDAVFCNDRSYYAGSLKSKDSNGMETIYNYSTPYYSNYFNAVARNYVLNLSGNVEPSLDCANQEDAFQVSNEKAQLKHKVGLLTVDEVTLAGMGLRVDDISSSERAYLSTCETGPYNRCNEMWTMSPSEYSYNDNARNIAWSTKAQTEWVKYNHSVRPVLSLKAGTKYASGTGLGTDPYIVE